MYYKISDNKYMKVTYIPTKKLKGWQKELTDTFRQRRLDRAAEFDRADALVEQKTAIEEQFNAGEIGESQMIEAILDLDS